MIPGETFAAAGEIVLNSPSSNGRRDVYDEKSDRIQSTGLNVLSASEGVSFAKTDSIR